MSSLYIILSLLSLFQHGLSQGMPGMPGMPGGGQQQRAKPFKKYFSRIQCQVCELSMKHIIRETKFAFKKNPEITEGELFNLTDATCNPFKDEGIWITQYDIVKEAPKLKLKQMTKDEDEIGECERECETISYSCLEILDDNSIEIVEYIWANLGKLKRSIITNDVCPSYCKKEKGDVKKKSKMGKEPWYPLFDTEKRQMVQLMEAMPPGVQMYDPSMMNMDDMMESMKGMYGDDMPNFDDEGNVVEKKKKTKKKKKKKEKKPAGFMDYINDGIGAVKTWFEPFWGDDGRHPPMGEL